MKKWPHHQFPKHNHHNLNRKSSDFNHLVPALARMTPLTPHLSIIGLSTALEYSNILNNQATVHTKKVKRRADANSFKEKDHIQYTANDN